MPRKPKVPAGEGKNRTIFLRNDQVGRLREHAADLGCDPSDLVRAYLDWHLPPAGLDRTIHLRSRIELNWRQLIVYPEVTRALLDGWRDREMRVPVGLPTAARDARLLPETVGLLRRLGLPAPQMSTPHNKPKAMPPPRGERPGEALRPAALRDWAATAPTGLLMVFASPAALALTTGPNGRPDLFLASPAICSFPPEPDPMPLPEEQYDMPAPSLRQLVRERVVRAMTPAVMPRGSTPWNMFRVDWAAAVRWQAAHG